jgi:hypothetical protein
LTRLTIPDRSDIPLTKTPAQANDKLPNFVSLACAAGKGSDQAETELTTSEGHGSRRAAPLAFPEQFGRGIAGGDEKPIPCPTFKKIDCTAIWPKKEQNLIPHALESVATTGSANVYNGGSLSVAAEIAA